MDSDCSKLICHHAQYHYSAGIHIKDARSRDPNFTDADYLQMLKDRSPLKAGASAEQEAVEQLAKSHSCLREVC